MAKIRQRLSGRGGFTLAEVLMTVIIMLLATAIVVAGVPAAINVYRQAVDAANAQTLLSTTMIRLRDEFCTATEIEVDSNGTTIHYRDSDGLVSSLSQDSVMVPASGQSTQGKVVSGICKSYGANAPVPDDLKGSRLLISQLASGNKEMYIRYDGSSQSGGTSQSAAVSYGNGVLTFHMLQVCRGTGDSAVVLATLEDYQIRVLSVVTPG